MRKTTESGAALEWGSSFFLLPLTALRRLPCLILCTLFRPVNPVAPVACDAGAGRAGCAAAVMWPVDASVVHILYGVLFLCTFFEGRGGRRRTGAGKRG